MRSRLSWLPGLFRRRSAASFRTEFGAWAPEFSALLGSVRKGVLGTGQGVRRREGRVERHVGHRRLRARALAPRGIPHPGRSRAGCPRSRCPLSAPNEHSVSRKLSNTRSRHGTLRQCSCSGCWLSSRSLQRLRVAPQVTPGLIRLSAPRRSPTGGRRSIHPGRTPAPTRVSSASCQCTATEGLRVTSA